MARPKKLPDGMIERPGRKGFFADFQIDGRRVRKFLSSQYDAACKILNTLKARADQASFGMVDNNLPIAELKTAYLRHVAQARPRSLTRYALSLDTIIAGLGASKVLQIDAAGILAFRQERLETVSPRTVNHDVTVLGIMLNWGVKHRMIGHNPFKGLSQLRNDDPKEGRPFTSGEVDALLKKSPQPWRDIWYALLVTGMRSGEVAALTFDDIDWEARELTVRADTAKNHTGRRIPIEAGLYAILERQRDNREGRQIGCGKTPKITRLVHGRFTRDHVFVTSQNTPLTHRSCLWGALVRCCEVAGIERQRLDSQGEEIDHVDVHSFRRTFATDAISNGADPKSIQEILGHKTLDMTMRIYTKIQRSTKRQAVAKLSYGQGVSQPEHLVQFQTRAG